MPRCEASNRNRCLRTQRHGSLNAHRVLAGESGWRAEGATVPVALRETDAEAEAAVGFTNAVVQAAGIYYILPPGGNTRPEVPRQVFRVYQNFVTDDGHPGRTKAFRLSYGIDNPVPVREFFPRAAPVSLKSDTK